MSKKINKISNLKHLESFLQINYLKGFKYIDKVGEVLNLYQSESGEIDYNMNPEKLIIPKPIEGIAEIKVSNVDLWCHYIDPNNLGEAERKFIKEAEKILKIIEIEKVIRVGWRNYFIHELSSKPENLNLLTKISKASTEELHLKLNLSDDIKSTARIKLLKQKDNDKKVLFFDLDTYVEKKLDLTESFKFFNKLKQSIESKDTLSLLNEIASLI